jgi:PhnB protein
MVKAIPEGYHSIQPYLVSKDAEKIIEFASKAFGAEELMRMPGPDGGVMHAEFKIGDSIVMTGGSPDQASQPATVLFYTEGVDEVYKRALQAGGTSEREPEDQFYGDRTAGVKDPAGNTWWIHTNVEQVSEQEMEKRMKEMAPA